ncbi:hypothetical protein J2X97_002258 [Epilithonimonas hungarica]|uniref:lantibiotic dehydratase family protein n=1 Tax=Epilithonimonas hungarica TaxID=454006 RepID=UPI00278966F2|nr:lantibiotic dehydratase family protein [Epilithonimonas hungarica]MDP9956599.1 hypothetical protein [Epilithonimonas hungarica]
MPRFPYQFFNEFIVRTPFLSYKEFLNNFTENTNDENIQKLLYDNTFREAIYLASPFLIQEIEKCLLQKGFSKISGKLKNTILKYISRITTRSTPFGLFAGVGIGQFSSLETNNNNLSPKKYARDTKVDMHFLVNLAYHFSKIPEIRKHLKFFPNNSIYKVGNKIRFVEYELSEGKRNYVISSAPLSAELESVLKHSNNGSKAEEITRLLMRAEISSDDAREFVEELIANKVLVSELEPNVSGVDFLNSIISVLIRANSIEQVKILYDIQNKLKELDDTIGNSDRTYSEIENSIKLLNCEYDQKYLLQTDLYCKDIFVLSSKWKKQLKEGISFLNKISLANKETHLEKFKKAFLERYEHQEVPLMLALDTEIGIGYQQDLLTKGIHPYLDDLELSPAKEKPSMDLLINSVQQILNAKLQEAQLENRYCIELTDEDFEDYKENWENLSETMSVMAEVVTENDREQLFINGGNGNAGRLLGRFCSEKSNIKELVKEIAKIESELVDSKILAEIIHLPDARIGNIIRRPTIRNYEIPFLAKSVIPSENQILVDDLCITIKEGRIILRSKKLNKEIIPHLTNAHNYYTNSLPVYHFLSDLNSQNRRTGLYFSWGDLEKIYHFFPRVKYKNIILSKAQWKVSEKEIKFLFDYISDKKMLMNEIYIWQHKRRIPQWIQWVKSDNTLTINLKNYDLVHMWLQDVRNENQVTVEEFLYNINDTFKREFIFALHK